MSAAGDGVLLGWQIRPRDANGPALDGALAAALDRHAEKFGAAAEAVVCRPETARALAASPVAEGLLLVGLPHVAAGVLYLGTRAAAEAAGR